MSDICDLKIVEAVSMNAIAQDSRDRRQNCKIDFILDEIRSAAATGLFDACFRIPLSDAVQEALTIKGYVVTAEKEMPPVYKISWGSTVSGVTLSPTTITASKGSIYKFIATVNGTNSPSQEVLWSVEGASAGTKITNGFLEVASNQEAGTFTISAVSIVDKSKKGTATVTVA
jgi:hypothetical protein